MSIGCHSLSAAAHLTLSVLPFVEHFQHASFHAEGTHGREGAYVAARINGELVGAPDRASLLLANPWEAFNYRPDKNYTYYIPFKTESMAKSIEVFVLGYDEEYLDFNA